MRQAFVGVTGLSLLFSSACTGGGAWSEWEAGVRGWAAENVFQDSLPSWSPDGTKIAFTTNRDDQDFEIYVMNADGSGVTNVTPGTPDTFEFDGCCDWGVLTPANRDECKDGGFQRFNSANFERFRNQGQCVAFANQSERNRL